MIDIAQMLALTALWDLERARALTALRRGGDVPCHPKPPSRIRINQRLRCSDLLGELRGPRRLEERFIC